MKRFDQRNILKKKVNEYHNPLYVKEREVRSAHLGENVGNEEDGKGGRFQRPVLIIKRVGAMLFVVPMTTRGKDSKYFYTLSDHYFGKVSRVMLSQARHIDKRRLNDKIGMIHKDDFLAIKKKLRGLIL